MPHSDTYRKRLTEEIEKSDEGARAKLARQRELEFYESAVMESDHQAKRKFPVADEKDLKVRRARRRFPQAARAAPVIVSVAGARSQEENNVEKSVPRTAVRKILSVRTRSYGRAMVHPWSA